MASKHIFRTDWLKFALYLVVVVLINVASSHVFFRVDLTRNRAYSLSSASKEVLNTLSEPLTIKAFFTRSLPYPYNNVEQQVRDLLEEYGLHANRYFNYTIHSLEPETDGSTEKAQEFRQMAQDYGIYPIQIQKIEQDEVKLQTAYLGMVLLHGDMVETISALTATNNLEYTITSAIEKLANKTSVLLNLEEDVEVTLYLSSSLEGLNARLRGMATDIQSVVRDLNRKHYDRLVFTRVDPDRVDPSTDSRAIEAMQDYSFTKLSLSSGRTAYAGLVISHGDRHRVVNLITQGLFGAEVRDPTTMDTIIEESMETLIGIHSRVGFVADHATLSSEAAQFLSPTNQITYDTFRRILRGSYTVEDINLLEDEIPEGISTLVIAGPRQPFTEYELFKIDQFLMQGNSLALFLDSHNEIAQGGQNQFMQQPVYLPINTGLEKLLEHYGVRVRPSYILDENCFVDRRQSSSGGVQEIPFYFYPLLEKESMNQALVWMRNIPLLFMLDASPLERIHGSESPSTVIQLLVSSSESWEMSEEINLSNPLFLSPPSASDPSRGAQPLAYLIEGEIISYFADRPAPEPDTEGDEGAEAPGEGVITSESVARQADVMAGTTRGKVLLVGTSAILGDNVLDAAAKEPNSVFALNVMDYLSDREGFAVMRTKGSLYNPLEEIKPEKRTFIKMFNIAGLPLLVVLAGLLAWLGWVSRKKRIRRMFAHKVPRMQEGGE